MTKTQYTDLMAEARGYVQAMTPARLRAFVASQRSAGKPCKRWGTKKGSK